MKILAVPKPTILKQIQKKKVWLDKYVLLASLSLITINSALASERYVYAKVFVDGDGVEYGYGYMREVYLDVVNIPDEIVVEQDSGILFTDGSTKKPLSDIQTRALDFVKPHLKELGFKTVSDYKIFLSPGDKDKAHSDMETVQKLRAASFAEPSKFSGAKAELHGVWTGNEAGANNNQPTSADEKATPTDKKPETSNNPPNQAPAEKKPTSIATPNTKTITNEKQEVSKENKETPTPNQAVTQKKAMAADSTKTKVAVSKEKKKFRKENKKYPATTTKKPMVENTKAETHTKPKIDSRIVKEMIYADSLGERQAQTWCSKFMIRFQKSMANSNNKLISIGDCSCKPQGDPALPQNEYRCGFPVTYRVPTNNEISD